MGAGKDWGCVAVKLQIEHITQNDNDLRGDCGPAVVAMLAGRTIEQALEACGLRPHQWATFGHLTRGLRYHAIHSTYIRGMQPPELRRHVVEGRPVVCLIDYSKLPAKLRALPYNGAHFILLAGVDDDNDDLLVHDPLAAVGYLPYPGEVLAAAQQRVPGNTFDFQSLVVHRDYGPGDDTARDTINALRLELERVTEERDAFRQALEACQAARRKLAEKAAQ